MTDPFHDIGKKLPYQESEEYLDRLISKTTEEAIRQHAERKSLFRNKRMGMTITSAAAVALLIIGLGITLSNNHVTQSATMTMQSTGPIDEFLNTLTDEEVAQLPDFEIEEIPEY